MKTRIIFCLATLLLWSFFNANPSIADDWYRLGFYPIIRFTFSSLGYFLPFPLLYVFIVILLIYLVYSFVQWRKGVGQPNNKWKRLGIGISKFLLGIYIAFNWLWGFNYTASTLPEHLNFTNEQPDSTLFLETLVELTATLHSLRSSIQEDTIALNTSVYTMDWGHGIEEELVQVFHENGYGFPKANRVRLLYPKGSLMHIGTAGFYMPFTGEGHVDAGMHIIKQPFTTAHELAHAYGITDEGECNFWAFLCCTRENMPKSVQYSGYLSMWRYFMRNLYQYDQSRYFEIIADCSPSILNDIKAIQSASDKYPDIFPELRDWMYDSYLKAQGVEEGNLSYGKVSYYYLKYLETLK